VATLLTSPPDQKQRAGGEDLNAGTEGDARTWRQGDEETRRLGTVVTAFVEFRGWKGDGEW